MDNLGSLVIIQGLLWGWSVGLNGGNLGPSLGVLRDHPRGILKIYLEVLWSHIGGTMNVTLGVL